MMRVRSVKENQLSLNCFLIMNNNYDKINSINKTVIMIYCYNIILLFHLNTFYVYIIAYVPDQNTKII